MSSVMEDDKKRGVVFDAPVAAKTEVGQETSLEHVMYADFAGRSAQWKQEQESMLLKKIDLRLMPLLTLIYLLNYLDRANLAQARQGNLEKDLGMTGADYNLATSIFFVGYLFMQLPSNILITKVRPSIYLATVVTLWGVVSTCNAAAKNLTHLILVRFFLGFAEAPFFPGAVYIMSCWYTRAELTRRVAWFYTGSSLASMFGGLIGYGVLKDLDGAAGLSGWRWLFIIEGIATIAVALFAAVILPDYPKTSKWLSEEERAFACWRLAKDINADKASDTANIPTGLMAGVKLAFQDYRIYLFIVIHHLNSLASTVTFFFPSIVETLDVPKLTALLLTVPVWFTTFLVCVAANFTAAKTNDKSIHIMLLTAVAAVGSVVLVTTTSFASRYFAMFLVPIGFSASYTIIVSWISNSFPLPDVKRSSAIAIINSIGNTASIYGSYMYEKNTAPQYLPGGAATAGVCVAIIIVTYVLRRVHIWENSKLDEAEMEADGAEAGIVAPPPPSRIIPPGYRYLY